MLEPYVHRKNSEERDKWYSSIESEDVINEMLLTPHSSCGPLSRPSVCLRIFEEEESGGQF
ncbi:hypothetical protein DNH61_04860 [Paenibacillus sambharensis]|uniref:Uncharacterized protein n=1 Tax=Paenibacillus sambharensis TaxID=1803190 RepID=A0A2W1LFZ7_9BACL|nr:hypothetical protein DNH61_04860 [Paenibacillus sambharensis]